MRRSTVIRWSILSLLILPLVFLVLANFAFYLTEDSRFRGNVRPQDYKYPFEESFREVLLNTEDDGLINLVLFEKVNSEYILLLIPGTNSHIENSYKLAKGWHKLPVDIVLMEYRGSGKSLGETSEEVLYKDVEAIYCYLSELSSKKVIVIGHSIGSTIAAKLITKFCPEFTVLVSPLYSINERFKKRPFWYYRKYSFPTYKYLPESRSPASIVVGSNDPLLEQCRQLHLISPECISLHIFPNEGHLSILSSVQFLDFIKKLITS